MTLAASGDFLKATDPDFYRRFTAVEAALGTDEATAALGASRVAVLSAAPVDAVAATDTITSNNTQVSVLTAATNKITSTNVQVTANDTVTVNGKVYKFVASPAVEGDVHFVTDADTSLTNLAAAINHTGTPDTDYKCAGAHPTVSSGAVGAVTAHAIVLTALTAGAAGNALTLAVSAVTLSVTGATFAGGLDADTVTVNGKVYTFVTSPTVEGDVHAVTNADTSLTNLVNAIMHTGTPDTDYKCAAVHPTVSAAAVGSHATVLSALTKGVAGNALTLAKSATTLSLTGALFSGGIDGTPGVANTFGTFGGAVYFCSATATIADAGKWKKVTLGSL